MSQRPCHDSFSGCRTEGPTHLPTPPVSLNLHREVRVPLSDLPTFLSFETLTRHPSDRTRGPGTTTVRLTTPWGSVRLPRFGCRPSLRTRGCVHPYSRRLSDGSTCVEGDFRPSFRPLIRVGPTTGVLWDFNRLGRFTRYHRARRGAGRLDYV